MDEFDRMDALFASFVEQTEAMQKVRQWCSDHGGCMDVACSCADRFRDLDNPNRVRSPAPLRLISVKTPIL